MDTLNQLELADTFELINMLLRNLGDFKKAELVLVDNQSTSLLRKPTNEKRVNRILKIALNTIFFYVC